MTQHKRFVSYCTLTVTVAGLLGLDVTAPSLVDVARFSDTIGVVRVVDRRPATFEVGGRLHECGYVYEAIVLDSAKGKTRGEGFKFFSEFNASGYGGGVFFIAVSRRSEDAAARELARVSLQPSGVEASRLRCIIEAADLTVATAPEAMIVAARHDLSDQQDGPWFPREESTLLARPEFVSVSLRDRNIVSWRAIREVITSAIKSGS